MRIDFPRHIGVVLVMTLFTIVFASAPVICQSGRAMSAARRVDEFSKQNDKITHDQMQSELHGRKPTKEELRKIEQAKAETKADLESLQASYNEIVGVLTGGKEIAPDFVSTMATKIHKSASRLRTNVAIPKPKESLVIQAPAESRTELKRLCLKIYAFLTNPIIETPSVVDVESASKAGESLDAILALSDRLKSKSN